MPEDTDTAAPVSPERKRVQETQKAADVAAERASHLRFEAARDLKNAERQLEHAAELRKAAFEGKYGGSVDGGAGDEQAWKDAEKSERYAKQLQKDAAQKQQEAEKAQAAADELQVEADEAAQAVGQANPEQPSVTPEPAGPTDGDIAPSDPGQGSEPGDFEPTEQGDTRIAAHDEVGDLTSPDGGGLALDAEPSGTAGGDEGATVPDQGADVDGYDDGLTAPDEGSDVGITIPDEPVMPAYEPEVMEPELQVDEPAPLEELEPES